MRGAAWKHGLPKLAALVLLTALFALGGCGTKSVPPPGAHPSTPKVQTSSRTSAKAQAVIRTARLLIGAPYKWGGTSPQKGFDCSGLVWFVYRQHGITLPRISWQQFGAGQSVRYSDLRPGDLVFFKIDKSGKSLHVGILTDRGTFVHAPSSGKRVMESSLNNTYWREHYIGARRVL